MSVSSSVSACIREPSGSLGNLENTIGRHHIELAGDVEAERCDRAHRQAPILLIHGDAVRVPEAAQKTSAVVRVEIVAVNVWDRAPAIHVSTRYGARPADVGGVVDYRQRQPGLRARRGVIAAQAFHHAPAVIDTCLRGGGDVNFFVGVLAYIGDVEQTSRSVERVAPRIPQSLRPDFTTLVRLAEEWVARGTDVRIAVIDVEPQQGTE